jgi:Reverse transcriptase (RNA-dependent DNA polymerase)
MLTTLLENKVRGGKWHALIDKVYAELNLYTAARKVTGKDKAAGVDGQSCAAFEEHLLVETRQLAEQIKSQTYRPQAVRRVHIPKLGRPNETRPLGIPTVRDRVVQRAIVNVIEPILDHQFHERSFGFRHGRGAHDALRIVEQKLQDGYVYVVDADLKGYFDTIPKDRLLMLIKEHISDSRVLKLIKMFLDQSILEELREWTPIAGVPSTHEACVPGCSFSGVVESVSQPAGSSDGWQRLRDGALRGRLCRSLPYSLRRRSGPGNDHTMGGASRFDSASHEDEDRGQSRRKFRVPGLLVSRGQDLSASREPGKDEGPTQGTDASQETRFPEVDCRRTQPCVARLVRLLSPLSLDDLQRP